MNKKNIITFPLKFSLDLKRESLIFLKEKEYHFSFFNEKHKKIKKTLITTPWEKVSERKKITLFNETILQIFIHSDTYTK